MNMHRFIVVIPFRNVRQYIADCYHSVISQHYPSFEIYFLDDDSEDQTLDIVPDEYEEVHKVRNRARLGPLGNVCNFLAAGRFENDDVIVLLDGDDYLVGRHVFEMLNYYYNENGLITYGQYMDNFGRMGHCSAYTEDEYARLRQEIWKASHLKTFKYKLYREFLRQDPEGNAHRDGQGNYFMATSDMAIMFPLLEIAGFENIVFNRNIIYGYRQHPNNDHANEHTRLVQHYAEQELRRKQPFSRAF